ncbi:Integrase catalytic domain-containing protein, partial [Aphis craccivora]
IASLTVRRGQLKASLTRFVTYVRSESRDIAQIEVRRSKIEENWNEFQEDFEELYFKIVTEANKLINATEKKDINEMVLSGENRGDADLIQPQAMIKLPALDIPIFSGRYEE